MAKHILSVILIAAGLFFTPAAEATAPVKLPSATGGKAVAYAMPLFAAGVTVWKEDWNGTAQLFVVTSLTVATAYGLKQIVRERRPYQDPTDHSTGWDSFPSTTSALAAAPSSFMWNRYGWEWGLPLFVVSKYTTYSLDHAKQNKIWDGLASTAISFIYNQLITTRYRPHNGLYTDLQASPDGVYATVNYRW